MTGTSYAGFAGTRIATESHGDPGDPTVVLIHGGGQTRAAWKETAEELAMAGRHVVSLDLRGHGESEWPEDGRYDLDAFAGDLRAVIAALGVRPVVVAASLGGWAALAALGEQGQHLATGLVLVDAPPRVDPAAARHFADAMRRRAEQSAEPLGWDPRVMGGIDVETVPQRLLAAAGSIALPVLIVRGAQSRIAAPDAVEELIARLPDVESIEVPDEVHPATSERAEAFNAVLLEFLERRAPRAAPEFRTGSDSRTLRDALGCFATGVTLVTTRDTDGTPLGLTANSFTSVSLDPPLLLVCIARSSASLASFESAEHFAVNVLQIGQQLASNRFAKRDTRSFDAEDWEDGENGVPLLRRALVNFECSREACHDGGDHVILVGRVTRAQFEPRRDPLLFFRGRYRSLHFD